MPAADFREPLNAPELQAALAGSVIGQKVVVLDQTSSTNDIVLEMSNMTPGEGLVVFAEQQTAGRGQRGNAWESAAALGLWFSILLRPRLQPSESARLTDWAARAVADTIRRIFDLDTVIKAPNDVLLDGKKIAGILVEMRAQKAAPHLAIAGIGLNVNHEAVDFPESLRANAISVAMALGRKVDREPLALSLLRHLDRTYGESFPR